MDDPFVRDYEASELKIAAEFLTNWLPFLTRDLCDGCAASMRDRIRSLDLEGAVEHSADEGGDADPGEALPSSPGSVDNGEAGGTADPGVRSPRIRMSWADMAQEDELEMEAEEAKGQAPADTEEGGREVQAVEETKKVGPVAEEKKTELSREQREYIRFMNVGRKKDFIYLERVKGKIVNILDGLELHTGVFSAAEQKRIVDSVYELQDKGRRGELGERTYSEPEKWMRGKGRATIQFGCCYNYAMDRDGNPPGILRNVTADPIPQLFKVIVKRLIRWHVLPPSCTPDSCIVNIYEPGDCIPPHIDSHDFVRPFCTISFLSECNIVFGFNLKVAGPGDFIGSTAIPLPVGSVLVLKGNGADVAKHCVPGVAQKRISITFRKMDEAKWPFGFQPEPDLQGIQPLVYDTDASNNQKSSHRNANSGPSAENRGLESQHTYSARHSEPRSRKALPRDVVVGKGRRRPSRVVVNGRSVLDGGKAEEPAGPSSQTSPPVSDLPGILPLPEGAAEMTRRPSSHPVRTPGRTVSVEQKRIVIRSYVDDGEPESPSSLVSSGPPGNHPRFPGTRSIDRRRWRVGLSADGAD
ncbi:hypothetical protein Taro_011378 [Colocasia esculenta]|uniref:Fe2OG dioxygenase domain-containing protein n=1 Tax=Colocasia esculenta TaxID=4460 RepID=A0A843U1B4_COLES|nr:hypothetical protein [Colocasia esculenta]